jgi:glycosyltransferase involved in cell wall biosynthesis
MNKVVEMGMSNKFLFTGFLRGRDVTKAFQMADVFVMPSVSEPFGIAPLESMSQGTPALISKQSGVSEILSHCLKVDFWDIDEMSNKIIAALKYPALMQCLKQNGKEEVNKISWDEPAKKCIEVYKEVMTI